jgi:uncharacterized membrane protein
LHPVVVHFPIVLTVLLPLVALVALLAIRRGGPARTLWAIPLVLAAALTASAWVAEETGGNDEEVVEEVVPHDAIEVHEERAERFVVLSGALLAVMGAGLLGGTVGQAARLVGTVGAVALLVPMAMVGSSGGDLVYDHGAASAWVERAGVEQAGGQSLPGAATARSGREDQRGESGDDPGEGN